MGKKDSSPALNVSILLVVPEGTDHQNAAQSFLDNQGQPTQPIFFNSKQATVKIALVRELLQHSGYSRAASEPQTIVLCAADSATMPAQNALLKIVEEPTANTQIMLVANSRRKLLPTLLSRCREIIWAGDEAENTNDNESDLDQHLAELQKFLATPDIFNHSQLIELADKLKDRQTAIKVLKTLLYQMKDTNQQIAPKIVQNLLSALDSLEKNGNVRLVLEHYLFTIRQLSST
jgi:DNA polymerase III delta prime subunit